MAHYAFIDDQGIVVDVIVGKEENEDGIDWEQYYGEFKGMTCKRTSYNTYGNKHQNGQVPFRKNYAGIGYKYDADNDAFIPPKPFDSWHLNTETYLWDAPIPMPLDGIFRMWNETQLQWVEQ